MVLVQLDLTDKENEIVNVCKARSRFITKTDAIKEIIKIYGEKQK